MRNQSRSYAHAESSDVHFVSMLERRRISGHHFGPGGSLEILQHHVIPLAKKGDTAMQMQAAATYRTIATHLGVCGALYRPRAVQYLHRAKKFATEAFLEEGKNTLLLRALAIISIKLGYKSRTIINYEYVHILMSCYAIWTKEVLRSRMLVNPRDREVVQVCHTMIMKGGREETKMLSMATLVESSWIDREKEKQYRWRLAHFSVEHYERLMDVKSLSDQDIYVAHVLCRVLRANGDLLRVTALASKYGFGDQLHKAQKLRQKELM